MKTILILAFLLSGCSTLPCENIVNKEVEANNKFTGMNVSWYIMHTHGHDAEVHRGFPNSIGINSDICKLPYSHQQFIVKHEFAHLISFKDDSTKKLTYTGLEDIANTIAGSMSRDQGVDITEYISYSDKMCTIRGQYWCDRSYYARYGFSNYYIDFSK